jgi:hypothetical protein
MPADRGGTLAACLEARAPEKSNHIKEKKQGATGITTVAPYIAGQWGRGNNRLLERLGSPEVVPGVAKYFQIFSYTVK